VDVTMPQLGETVTEGTITRWLKRVGDRVEADEPLFEVSTDKVDSEVPAPGPGFLAEILAPEGETVQVGARIAVLSGEASASREPASDDAEQSLTAPSPAPEVVPPTPPTPEPAPEPVVAAAPAQPEAAPTAQPAPTGSPAPEAQAQPEQAAGMWRPEGAQSEGLTSPIVRRLVAEKGLDPATIVGTGPGGRLTRKDVLDAASRGTTSPAEAPAVSLAEAPASATPAPAVSEPPVAAPGPAAEVSSEPEPQPPALSFTPVESAPAPAPSPAPASAPAATAAPGVAAGPRDEIVPFDNVRRRTAEHMVRSLDTSAHVYTSVEVDFERVEKVRAAHRKQWKAVEGFSLTYLPFVLRAFCDVVNDFPHVNASVGDDALVVHRDVNVGIAVDLDFKGLLAPVIRAADGKRLRALARDVNDLATRARTKRLQPDELSGGTFTITNPGPYGTFATMPIINQPQVAILSTDGIKKRPVVVTGPDGDDAIAIHHAGLLVLTWDHRAFDGAYAAAFLHAMRTVLEQREWEAELD
jgi:2-oxoglutarate dehydrogenase E2 component (dihydrolipoamide succinyltransferase)